MAAATPATTGTHLVQAHPSSTTGSSRGGSLSPAVAGSAVMGSTSTGGRHDPRCALRAASTPGLRWSLAGPVDRVASTACRPGS